MSELDDERRIDFLKNIKETQIIITCTQKLSIKNIEMSQYEVKEGKVFKKDS